MSSRLGNGYATRIFNEKQRPANGGWIAAPLYNDRSLWSIKAQAIRALSRAKRMLMRQGEYSSSYRTPRSPKIRPAAASAALPAATEELSANIKFVVLCAIWYTTSALSSNTGKAIMIQFRYPITLTIVQFAFVAAYSLLFMSPLVRFARMRMPTAAIIRSTLPMGMFQVGGHILSSLAISRIPVSTTHTIKALSPLFTVAAYALLFGVSYSAKTYLSLLPLTVGVMLACSFDMSASNAVGLLCAFGSALVFVSSNIFFKKVMPSGSEKTSHKLDKLNLLFYSSSMAFVLMVPIWMFYDLPLLLALKNDPDHIVHPHHGHSAPHSVNYYFFMNGTVHFGQNLIAFIILSSTSPVTYSIASLIKRVAVICIAIVWFNQTVHLIQAVGIILTFTGLYMYNNAKSDVEQGEKKMRRVEAARDLMLPTSKIDMEIMGMDPVPEMNLSSGRHAETSGFGVVNASVTGRVRPPPSASRGNFHPRPPNPTRTSYNGQVTQTTHTVPPPLSIPPVAPQHLLNPIQSPMKELQMMKSPVDSYPSPPPSLDSPPLRSVPLGYAEHKGHVQLNDIQERLGPALQQIQVR